VTERFALKMKYFYDDENLEAFRQEYADMPLHKKTIENPLLTGGSLVTMLSILLGLLMISGII
jgi:restriction endonuclease Mrr